MAEHHGLTGFVGMIFRRRALQRRLNELRCVLDGKAVDALAKRLNCAGKDRVAAMWEVVVFHALSKCGAFQHEVALTTQRRPDILFENGGIRLIADVTSVSDEGLDKDNPYYDLSQLVEAAKNKLKLPTGGLHIDVRSKQESSKRGSRTVLKLPPRAKLQAFVDQRIVPELRKHILAGNSPLRIHIDDADVGLDITIDPAKSPYSSASFAAYDAPQIKDRNPLYSALRIKAQQLRGAEGVVGVVVGDGDCVALSDRSTNWQAVSTEQIVQEFFRQFSSVDFVLLLSVREEARGWLNHRPLAHRNHARLFVRPECGASSELDCLFHAMVEQFPRPAMMPVNGALRAREDGYDLGHHGGYSMSGQNAVRIGLREFTEIFAGLRRIEDNGAKNVEAARELPQRANPLQSVVLRNLMMGRLPVAFEIIPTGEDDNDNWVEIRFGEVDPAIAPFR